MNPETARISNFWTTDRENRHSTSYDNFTSISWQDERKGAFFEQSHWVA